jgi:hypothetical protein
MPKDLSYERAQEVVDWLGKILDIRIPACSQLDDYIFLIDELTQETDRRVMAAAPPVQKP